MKGLEKCTSKAVRGNKEEGAKRRSRQEGRGVGLGEREWHRGRLQGFIVAVASLPLPFLFCRVCLNVPERLFQVASTQITEF